MLINGGCREEFLQQIDGAWEEPSFEDANYHPQSGKRTESLHESHPQHCSSPGCSDKRDVDARAKFADEQGGCRLKDDIGGEES